MKQIALWGLAVVVTLLLVVEIGLRVAGAGGFALYRPDPAMGYVPRENQAGAFMGRHWVFNEHSMGVATSFHPNAATDTLLIGDSVVYGGNPLDQPDRIGPILQQKLGAPVWPVSAGGWQLLNELAYLRVHPDVLAGVHRIVWVVNSGDFTDAHVWQTDRAHPRTHPLWLSAYIFDRTWGPKLYPGPPDPPEHNVTTWIDPWKHVAAMGKPILVVAYPGKDELDNPAKFHAAFQQLVEASPPNVRVVYLIDDRRWDAADYRDMVHPNAAGDHVLAQIIADGLEPQQPPPGQH